MVILVTEHVPVFYTSAVYLIENLHEDKRSEDHRGMLARFANVLNRVPIFSICKVCK